MFWSIANRKKWVLFRGSHWRLVAFPAPRVLSVVCAARWKATPSQVALAWLLARSPVILPIPGTSRVEHLEENVAAAELKIDANKMQELDRMARAG